MGDFVLKYWIEFLFSGVIGLFGYIVRRLLNQLKKEKREKEFLNRGVQALLRDRLIQSCRAFLKKGYCTIEERDNIANMYEQYHNLGANGVIDELIKDVLELPTIQK